MGNSVNANKTVLEFASAVMQKLPRGISRETMKAWCDDKSALGNALRETLLSPPVAPLTDVASISVEAIDCFEPQRFFPPGDSWLEGDNDSRPWHLYTAPFNVVHHCIRLVNDPGGSREDNIPSGRIVRMKLEKEAPDSSIIRALGGKKLCVTPLAHIAQLLLKQAGGKEGILRTDSEANVFYVQSKIQMDQLILLALTWNPPQCPEGWYVSGPFVGYVHDAGASIFRFEPSELVAA